MHAIDYMYAHLYFTFMPKRPVPPPASRPRLAREPVQVYLAPDDSALLKHLTAESGLSKAEILRRGMRSYAREHGELSPMLRFLAESGGEESPAGVAADHDAVLADAYRGAPRRKRR